MDTPPDSTRDALYAAILAHPDEDTPRLAYADHIEEQGDSHRAEFIRVQIRLATLNPWDDGYTALDVRCRRLLAEHPEWLEPVRPFTMIKELATGFVASPLVRGFIGYTEQTAEEFLKNHDKMFAAVPVRSVSLRGADADACRQLVISGAVGRLRELDIEISDDRNQTTGPGVETLKALAAIPDLTALTKLAVECFDLPVKSLKPLATCPHLRELRSLTLRYPAIFGTDKEALAAARWDWPPALRELVLDGCIMGEGVLALLLKAPLFTRLERFTMEGGEREDVEAVFGALTEGRLDGLISLEAGGIGMDDANLFGPLQKLTRPRLQSLRLHGLRPGFKMEKADAQALFDSPWLRDLRRLEILGSGTPDTWLSAIANAPFAKSLRVLDLGTSGFEPETLREAFGANREWPELQQLSLGSTHCPADMFASLLDPERFPKLTSLAGYQKEPVSEFLKELLKSPALARLRELNLWVPLDDAGAAALLASPHLKDIDVLTVMEGTAGQIARDRLKGRFGSRITLDAIIPL